MTFEALRHQSPVTGSQFVSSRRTDIDAMFSWPLKYTDGALAVDSCLVGMLGVGNYI